MKFYYSQSLQKFVCSDLGNIVDSDDSLASLLDKRGMLEKDNKQDEWKEEEESDDN